jgi:hypothetical protein
MGCGHEGGIGPCFGLVLRGKARLLCQQRRCCRPRQGAEPFGHCPAQRTANIHPQEKPGEAAAEGAAADGAEPPSSIGGGEEKQQQEQPPPQQQQRQQAAASSGKAAAAVVSKDEEAALSERLNKVEGGVATAVAQVFTDTDGRRVGLPS